MNPLLLPMVPIHFVDVAGSILMILFGILCVRHALTLKKKESQNVIWTYLLWFCSGILIFATSRAAGHLIKYLLSLIEHPQNWLILLSIIGALSTVSFVIVSAITLFFSRIYHTYRQMQEDKATIERFQAEIIQFNINLEKMVQERTLALSASEEKYRRVFEGSKDMLFICNENGDFLDINRFGVELLGFRDRKDVLGRNFFRDFIIQPDAMIMKEDIETRDFLKDVEVRLRKRDGGKLVVLFSASARKKEWNKSSGFEGTVKDITMRKIMEKQLIQADKLTSLGQLSAGVAHEINNPLGLILGYTQLILREAKEGSQLYEDLKIIEKHAINCKKIVEELLKFSRSIDTTKTTVNLNEMVIEVFGVVEAKFELDKVHTVKRLARDLPPATVDPDKMRQVFMNLLMNSRQAIDGPGTITVSTSLAADNNHIIISFADTGGGIPPDIIDKIFDPFFTTKPTGMGTGLGLSVSYGIIQDHDGEIQVESIPGNGTTFTIHLPTNTADSGNREIDHLEKDEP